MSRSSGSGWSKYETTHMVSTDSLTATIRPSVVSHPHVERAANLVYDSLFDAVTSGRLAIADTVMRLARQANFTRQDAEFASMNLFDALALPVGSPTAAALIAELFAHAISRRPVAKLPSDLPRAMVWLATYANVGVFESLDATAPEHAAWVWNNVSDLLCAHGTNGSGLSRAEAIVAAVSMGLSNNEIAKQRKAQVASLIAVPILTQTLLLTNRAAPEPARGQTQLATNAAAVPAAPVAVTATLVGTAPPPTVLAAAVPVQPTPAVEPDEWVEDITVTGELAPAPRGPVATVLLALCGWLLVSHLARLFARFALQVRHPTQVTLTAQGMRIFTTTRLLGRSLGRKEQVIRWAGLARATREVRFARIGLYAGLGALVCGSLLGLRWFVDGLRAGSWWMAFVGLAIVGAGVALDFVLTSWMPNRQGHCRIVLVPRGAKATCVAHVVAEETDALLLAVARTVGQA